MHNVSILNYIFDFLKAGDDLLGEVRGGSVTLEVLGDVLLARGQGLQSSLLDLVGVLVEAHVTKHHNRREQEGGGVGETLTGDIGGRTVDGLEDGGLNAHVTTGGQTKTTNETTAEVGHDVTVEVRHDHDVVLVGGGVLDHLQTGVINQLRVELNTGVVLGNLLSGVLEQTVTELHDRSLVDNHDLLLVVGLGVLEGILTHTLTGISSDKLDALHNARNDGVLDTTVLTLGVLTNENGVHIIVGGLVASNALAGTHVGEKVEGTTQGQVQTLVTLTNGGSEGTLKSNLVLVDGVDGVLGESGLAVDQAGGHVNRNPLNRNLGSSENLLHGLADLGTDTITLDDGNDVVAIRVGLSGVRSDRVLTQKRTDAGETLAQRKHVVGEEDG